ncbi:hypothetical protein ACHAQA_005174 [Verticillium albo-atrum]
MPVLPAIIPASQATKMIMTRAGDASSMPSVTSLPAPDANFIPLYVLVGLVPLTVIAIILYAYRLERKALRSMPRDVELQSLRTHWFPWREAIDIASPTTHTARTTTIPGTGGSTTTTVVNTHPAPSVATNADISSTFTLSKPPAAAAAARSHTEEAPTAAEVGSSTTNLLDRVRVGEATTVLPTTLKDWHSVHAALLPHRFGTRSKPNAKSNTTAGTPRPGGPKSPTITAPSFIGSSAPVAGPSQPRACWVEDEKSDTAEGVFVVGEDSDEDEAYEGKGKEKATFKSTARPIVIKIKDGEMF